MFRQCGYDKCGVRDRQKIIKMRNSSHRKKHKITVYLGMPTLKKVDCRGILGTRFLVKFQELLKIGKIEGMSKWVK